MSAAAIATITATAASTAAAVSSSAARAPAQGGILEGMNPSKFNPKDPITLFIIQVPRETPTLVSRDKDF